MFRALITAKGMAEYGDQVFTSAGTTSFTVPDNVEYISAVCIGGGGGSAGNYGPAGGHGGTLAYGTFKVSPGDVLSVTVGDRGTGGPYTFSASGSAGGNGEDSLIKLGGATLILAPGGRGGGSSDALSSVYFDPDATNKGSGAGGGAPSGDGRFTSNAQGGGGAGGYGGPGGKGAGASGSGGSGSTDGQAGSSGGGGGGGKGRYLPQVRSGNGGGTHLYGLGSNGSGGLGPPVNGGSGGAGSSDQGGSFGYGGGAGGSPGANYLAQQGSGGLNGSSGGRGAVRIVWPGRARAFPSQNVAEDD